MLFFFFLTMVILNSISFFKTDIYLTLWYKNNAMADSRPSLLWGGGKPHLVKRTKKYIKKYKKILARISQLQKGKKLCAPHPQDPPLIVSNRMPFPREITARNHVLYPTVMMSTIEIVPPTHSATTLSASL